MKDEEMAEQFANNGYALGCTKTPFESAKDGFLAGLKAGRPQWHDLQKDPKDLPKDTVSVLISRGTPRTSRARYNGKWYGYYSDDEIEDVIAWCEIPTFDKE